MTPERWRQITAIFHAARERDVAERQTFLANACREDVAMRHEVEAMLVGHEDAGAFGERPVFQGPSRLEPGFAFGPYRIERLIGAGGMGEVYRAQDANLGRAVAIKVLPAAFLGEPKWLDRLEREAHALAALNHPNIGAIYGVEHADGVYGLVLEFVDGPTLADRIARGPVSLDEALPIARQIADALEAAHERRLIHRDIKPSNIKVTPDGVVKVLDFGLAKTMAGEALSPGVGRSLAITMSGTRDGVIVGTAAYMSPEQARGQPVDRRADIWAFGCVLFEMLTGREVFGRETPSDTVAAILESEPSWDQLPPATPWSIRRLLRRCLEKDPKRRLRDIGDARLDIDDARTVPAIAPDAVPSVRAVRDAAWVAATLGVAATVMLAGWYFRPTPTADGRAIRFSVLPADVVARRGVPTLSPDGRRLAFVAKRDGVPMVWVRSLDAVDARPVPGSEDAYFAFWSPDSRSLAINTGKDGLKIVDEIAGSVRTLGRVGPLAGAMWCPDGRIVAGSLSRGLFALPVDGGSPLVQLTSFDLAHGEGGQVFPTMLPDGRHFLYLSEPSSSVWLASFDSTEKTRLMRADSQAVYVPPGYLLFVRRQTLFAQAFDLHRMTLTGEPMAIAEGVLSEVNYGADFTASSNGVVAYRSGTIHVPTQLTWVDRDGNRLGTVGPSGRYANIELSPDGGRVALEALDPRTYTKDIWVMELDRGVLTQLTFDSDNETFPIWSPDGRWIMFASDRDDGWWQLYRRRADGVGGDERVVTSAEAIVPQDWAPDGQSVIYLQRPANLGVLPLVEPRTPRLLFPQKRFEGGTSGLGSTDGYGQVSPDGRWLAYGSSESGQWEVYVQSFPTGDSAKWKISDDGGMSPRWRPDGREIFYYSTNDGRLVSVPITAGTALKIGAAVPRFKANLLGGPNPVIPWRNQYAITRDGQRFLLNVPLEDPYARAPITVVTNWIATLKR